jgi:putative addiction module antidote
MHALKVTTVGNSTGAVLPKEILNRLHISKGDTISLIEEPEGYKITPYNKGLINQMELAEEIMREDRDVLKVLAK